MRRLRWLALSLLCGLSLALVPVAPRADSQEIIQYGFEGRDTVWVQGNSKASFRETAHRITDEFARSGTKSEHLALAVEQGEFIYYTYNVGRAPVNDELTASIYVRANRPGVQLLARVVLPQERDPKNLAQPLTVIVRGDAYVHTSRWQQVVLRQPVKRLNEQVVLLRDELKRPDVNITGAYVDQLLLNVCCGPGQISIYLDDLEVGPCPRRQESGTRTRPRTPAA